MARRRSARREAARVRPPVAGTPGLSPAPFIGMGLMAASFFLYGSSLLVAPWYAVLALLLVWLGFFLLCTRWWTPYPRRLPAVAVVSMLVWFVLLVGGTVLL